MGSESEPQRVHGPDGFPLTWPGLFVAAKHEKEHPDHRVSCDPGRPTVCRECGPIGDEAK